MHVNPTESAVPDVPLSVQGLEFAYKNEPVLRDVSFSLARGEFVALVGPNGSGKSTLLRVLLGLLTPSKGSVTLLGVAPQRLHERWRIGYVPQRPALGEHSPASVREVVAAGRTSRRGWWRPQGVNDRDAINDAIREVALDEFADTPIRELSGGQQQRAFIAKALAGEPDLLILDEPIAGVDSQSQRAFRDVLVHLVQEHHTTILLVSHELGAVGDALDRVLVLREGTITFDGSPDSLKSQGVHLGVHADDLPLWLEQARSSISSPPPQLPGPSEES